MTSATDITGGPRLPRLPLIDMARGVAILAMIVYHFAWDLGYVRLIAVDVATEPGWIAFQRLIVGSFLFLTGVSLVLAHGRGVRWGPFWRRLAVIGGAALLVSAGTFAFSPETFVYFGVLHAIALFGLMGLAFLRAPLWLVFAAAAFCLALPLVVQSPVFEARVLSWIGLWVVPPPSEDLVPVFPWFGVVLAGMALTRIAVDAGLPERLAGIGARGRIARALATAGRWSLVIYLVHQPVMLGALMALASVAVSEETLRAGDFTASCEAACVQSAGSQSYCTAYCACALDRVEAGDFWALLETEARSQAEETALLDLTNQCAAEVLEGPPPE